VAITDGVTKLIMKNVAPAQNTPANIWMIRIEIIKKFIAIRLPKIIYSDDYTWNALDYLYMVKCPGKNWQ
jgi:hypothetical protein